MEGDPGSLAQRPEAPACAPSSRYTPAQTSPPRRPRHSPDPAGEQPGVPHVPLHKLQRQAVALQVPVRYEEDVPQPLSRRQQTQVSEHFPEVCAAHGGRGGLRE